MSVVVERAERLDESQLEELCSATALAVSDGGGFGWMATPTFEVLSAHWQSVLADPLRELFLARVAGEVAGSVQLARVGRSSESRRHSATVLALFVAPQYRRRGYASMLMRTLESYALTVGVRQLNLVVRQSQTSALALYRALGFQHWGTHPRYAYVDEGYIAGLHFDKLIAG